MIFLCSLLLLALFPVRCLHLSAARQTERLKASLMGQQGDDHAPGVQRQ